MTQFGNLKITDAPKRKWGVPEIDDNACARVFRSPMRTVKALELLAHKPAHGPAERAKPKIARDMMCQRISTGIWPISHTAQIYESISRILPNPYFARDINDPNFLRWAKTMHRRLEGALKGKRALSLDGDDDTDPEGVTMPSGYPKSMLICGPPGMGKSTIIKRMLATFYPGRVFSHIAVNGDVFIQIPYLYISCTHLHSAVALLRTIITEIAELAGYNPSHLCSLLKRGTFEQLLPEAAMLIALFSVGTIFIDEAEQIRSKASGGKVALGDVWVRMINECGTSLVLIANPDIRLGLGKQLRVRLRMCGMGAVKCDRLPRDSDDCKAYSYLLTQVQYTKTPTEITQEILDMLHEKSQGLIKVAALVWEFTNQLAIAESPGERITPELVAMAYRRNAVAIHEAIHGIARRTNKFDDVDCSWMENDAWIEDTKAAKETEGSEPEAGTEDLPSSTEDVNEPAQSGEEKPKAKPQKVIQKGLNPKIVEFVRCANDAEYLNGRSPHQALSDLGFIGAVDEFA